MGTLFQTLGVLQILGTQFQTLSTLFQTLGVLQILGTQLQTTKKPTFMCVLS